MTHKHGPVYELGQCAQCRVAFIRSSRPWRSKQDTDIYYINRYHNISIEQIHHELKTIG